MQRLKATPAKILGPLANNQRFCQRVHPFAPRLPWIGGDLQTLRATIRPQPERVDIGSSKQISLKVPLSESSLPLPVRRGFSPHLYVTLDYPPQEYRAQNGGTQNGRNQNGGTQTRAAQSELEQAELEQSGALQVMLLIHGMGGDEDSDYMRRTAQYFLKRGWYVARLNMRGTLGAAGGDAGASAATTDGAGALTGGSPDVAARADVGARADVSASPSASRAAARTASGGEARVGVATAAATAGAPAQAISHSREMGAYHAGLFEDINPVLDRLSVHFAGHAVEFSAMGFSLGGHLLLRYLSDESGRGRLKAGVSVSAPLDLAACQRRLEEPRNRIYNKYLTQVLKAQFAPLIQRMRVSEASLKSVRDIDDRIVGPLFGFGDSEGYYASQSVWPHLDKLHTPTLMLHAEDDPWIPVADYLRITWPQLMKTEHQAPSDTGNVDISDHILASAAAAASPVAPSGAPTHNPPQALEVLPMRAASHAGLGRQAARLPALTTYMGAVLAPSGGHVGFHSALTQVPWYVQASNLFLREISAL